MTDPRDRLFELLPGVYRDRDAAHGGPLRALLRLVAGQADELEAGVARMYANWFIETCEEWAVPYIGELVGYAPAPEAALAADAGGRALQRALTPRRDVANTLRARRRRGTAALLEGLSRDVAQWPGHAVELRRRVWTTANLRGTAPAGPPTAGVRDAGALARTGGPFDALARLPDVRRTGSSRRTGVPSVPGIGLWVWPMHTHSVTRSPAYCAEEVAPHAFTFSPLGNDAPLFAPLRPGQGVPDGGPGPDVITRRELHRRLADFYGEGKAFVIYTGPRPRPVPMERIVVADLSGWEYRPRRGQVAVDPERGRMAFPVRHAPKSGVWVSFYQGFSADMGGGEYPVRRPQFALRETKPVTETGTEPETELVSESGTRPETRAETKPGTEVVPETGTTPEPVSAGGAKTGPALYRVGERGRFPRLRDALAAWRRDDPPNGVIEITDSNVYGETVRLRLHRDQVLQIRAAPGARPVLRMLDLRNNRPDALRVHGAPGSALALDGLIVTGRPVHAEGELGCLVIRHCTLVPGWALRGDCEPLRPAEPSLEVFAPGACVTLEHSITGSIQVVLDEVAGDPVRLRVRDSIVDATGPEREAIGAPGCPVAHVLLEVARSTVFGRVQVHAIDRAEDSIFTGRVRVARRQLGCMRFCWAPPGSRTPRRHACQPDGVDAAAAALHPPDSPAGTTLRERERLRVRPRFGSVRYGNPRYARLTHDCAPEIVRGAADAGEMGAFHDLFQPQREANLRARLQQFTPAGLDAGILYAS